MKGTVKWFNDTKGYGFITGEDGNDYFAHYSNVLVEGRKTLIEGEPVFFDIQQTPKGMQAINIQKGA